ncbi:glycosyltransferase family A protein [Porifericola rhodea]|uniref:glycosyltransferase n=1 Tax=Porifericola rhodea TaxID=930972 RepID=UPI002665FF81|nr:glycosyltransferase family A protein [Porifericola rhodea]WKN32534.1 glycosyltransferase family A protein [Porifericola rhodea]
MQPLYNDNSLFVSVIIPVFNDSYRLKLCLQALKNQVIYNTQFDYEVIVVDNNSTENIEGLCGEYGARYIFESAKGSYAARNKGVSVAKGPFLAFTDSDCIPDTNWLESGLSKLAIHPEIGLLGGSIKLFTNNTNLTLGDIFDLSFAFPQKHYVNHNHFAATANMFTRTEVFHKVGMFASSMYSGGDYEWGRRVFFAGYKQHFSGNTIVKHPTRSSIKEIIRKSYRVNRNYNTKLQNDRTKNIRLFKYILELLAFPLAITSSIKKVKSSSILDQLSIWQKVKLVTLLICIYYVKTYAKIKEWIMLKLN